MENGPASSRHHDYDDKTFTEAARDLNGSIMADTHEKEEDVRCGILCCKPKWAAWLANPKLFVLCWCLAILMNIILAAGYVNGVLTTLEKRFQLQSKDLGIVASAADIGSMVTVLFVTYYGGKPGNSRPKILGVGLLGLALGAFLSGLPHFVAPAYEVDPESIPNLSSLESKDVCLANKTNEWCGKDAAAATSSQGGWFALLVFGQFIYGISGTPLMPLGTTFIDDHVRKESAPLYIGTSYIVFGLGPPLGFVLSSFAVRIYVDIDKGIDPATLGLTPANPLWVGAWWIGFFICGAGLLATAFPMFFFPHALKRPSDSDVIQKKDKSEKKKMLPMMDMDRGPPLLDPAKGLWKQIKGMTKSLKEVLTNGVFLVLCLSGVCMVSTFGAFSFMPKYLELQFGVPKSQANMLLGIVMLPSTVFGIVGSGIVIKKFKLTPVQCLYMSATSVFLSSLISIPMFFLTCPQPPMAGVTIPYGYSPFMPNAPYLKNGDINLISSCNTGCNCNLDKYSPVCGSDGVTYFSGCHAGCTEKQSFMHPMGIMISNFSRCGCLADLPPEVLMKMMAEKFGKSGAGAPPGGEDNPTGQKTHIDPMWATASPQKLARSNANTTDGVPTMNSNSTKPSVPGKENAMPGNGPPGFQGMPNFAISFPCRTDCNKWGAFIAVFVVGGFASSFGFIPVIISILRALTPETKSFGMGVQTVLMKLLGFIPSPIYFGALIDTTCRLWSTTCGKQGSCLLYDLDKNRYAYFGLIMALRTLGGFLILFAAYLFKRREQNKPLESKNGGVTKQDIAASLGSLTGSMHSLDRAGHDHPHHDVERDTEDLRANIWRKKFGDADHTPLA
ncbi:SLCO3A1 [Branchiostoma lanceolatum]|uniref:Solute carrier organic anion transporter family member n=1 Tax=Branchiostoma lanceolatum TaxID=7740 RepID=A0A8K0ECW1_BRALA|nr:SLCO3A1 [Branchiostoma lanceolatum]